MLGTPSIPFEDIFLLC